MKKLFLASSFSVSAIKIRNLLPRFENFTVAFIPTAADLSKRDPDWLQTDQKMLEALGFKVLFVDLKGKTESELSAILRKVEAIFVAGGNAFYLLDKIRQSGFDKVVKKLVEQGKIYIGSSAGSILAGPSVAPAILMDDPADAPGLTSYGALGLVDFVVLPHKGNEKYAPVYGRILDDPGNKKFELVPITDEQVVVVEGGRYKIV